MRSRYVYSRWSRHGHDRLYVRAADGTDLGWYDLSTLELHASGDNRAVLHDAATQWRKEHPVSRDDTPSNEQEATPRDLATAAPGMRVREEAERLRTERLERLRQDAGFWWFLKKRSSGPTPEEYSWQVGAQGEMTVGHQLSILSPAWAILHSIEVGHRGADIDHLVIGPPGAFTLNTKNHPGSSIFVTGNTFMVNRARYPYIDKSRFEAKRAADLLSRAVGFRVPVAPMIVPTGFRRLVIKETPGDVFVVPASEIARWLTGYPTIFPPHIVSKIYEKARFSTTWLT